MTRKQSLLVAGLALATVLVVWLAYTRNTFFDSRVYYGAVQHWFRDGGMVYDWMRPGTPYGFTYPPFAGLVMAPMAFLPFPLVLVISVVATVVTTALITWWLLPGKWRTPFAVAVAVCLAIAFEPVRETISFGQVNTLLLALVALDLLVLNKKWRGVGIGLATAIKLTPGIFILYLLVTRRFRAAFTAMGTATAATLAAAALYPDESREFWTAALWDTGRVGVLSYLSNQSLRGLVARLPVESIASYLWIVLVLAAVALWWWRVRRDPDDVVLGLALTGVLGCLISPVTWIHHCVWLLPALIRCFAAGGKARLLSVAAYVVMTSHLVWIWEPRPRPPLELIGSNLYVWFSIALLIWTPSYSTAKAREGPPKSRSSPVATQT